MKSLRTPLAAILLCTCLQRPALAQTAAPAPQPLVMDKATKDDIVCLAVFAVAVESAQTEQAKLGVYAAVGYFRGKLRARTPNLDLEAGLRQVVKAVQTGEQKSESARCAAEAQMIGQDLIKLGEALQR